MGEGLSGSTTKACPPPIKTETELATLFFLHVCIIYIYMFLKQEKPEMYDSEEKKSLVLKENILKNVPVFDGYPCKNVTEYFCIFYYFRTF